MAKIKAGQQEQEIIVETNNQPIKPTQNNNPPSRRSIIEANQKRKIATIEKNINAEVFVLKSLNTIKIFRELRATDALDSTLRNFWVIKLVQKIWKNGLNLLMRFIQKLQKQICMVKNY
ncbi:hypothetical protein [Helicobacter apodemus]|uniref:hypothetical protein n=1 Tax=Helicobacter apodemus TaxID=135569 RepID=UPI001EF29A35|nr:hypothetical protein [Helicobacter apodemus]